MLLNNGFWDVSPSPSAFDSLPTYNSCPSFSSTSKSSRAMF
jgi:hypothetical protein